MNFLILGIWSVLCSGVECIQNAVHHPRTLEFSIFPNWNCNHSILALHCSLLLPLASTMLSSISVVLLQIHAVYRASGTGSCLQGPSILSHVSKFPSSPRALLRPTNIPLPVSVLFYFSAHSPVDARVASTFCPAWKVLWTWLCANSSSLWVCFQLRSIF